MPRDLPCMANKQTIGFWGKDQAPTIFVGGRWAARASVKLPLDRRHAPSSHCFAASIYDGGRRRDAAFKAGQFQTASLPGRRLFRHLFVERGHYSLAFIQNRFFVDYHVSSLTGAVKE
jgi:hypothetical protein